MSDMMSSLEGRVSPAEGFKALRESHPFGFAKAFAAAVDPRHPRWPSSILALCE